MLLLVWLDNFVTNQDHTVDAFATQISDYKLNEAKHYSFNILVGFLICYIHTFLSSFLINLRIFLEQWYPCMFDTQTIATQVSNSNSK